MDHSSTGWERLPLGTALRAAINALLRERLPRLFGFHLLALGPFCEGLDCSASPVQRRWRLHAEAADLRALPEALPLRADSIDVVLMPLTLDFCSNPHEVLREAHRVLIGDGQLLLVGFNPWSLWGLRSLFSRKSFPWRARFLRPARVHDWLRLLGFEIQFEQYLEYRPPLRSSGWLQRFSWMNRLGQRFALPLGAVYVVSAQKRIYPLTPVRLQQRQPQFVWLPMGAPSPQREGLPQNLPQNRQQN